MLLSSLNSKHSYMIRQEQSFLLKKICPLEYSQSIDEQNKQTLQDFLPELLVYQSSLHFRLEKGLEVFSLQCLSL